MHSFKFASSNDETSELFWYKNPSLKKKGGHRLRPSIMVLGNDWGWFYQAIILLYWNAARGLKVCMVLQPQYEGV